MFKEGDKVVCIDINKSKSRIDIELILNKIYTITNICYYNAFHYVSIDVSEPAYLSTRFKLLSEVRKEKLNKLLNV